MINFKNSKLFSFFRKVNVPVNLFDNGFSEQEKKHIINSALTTSGQVLMSAVVLCGSENFIEGDCVYPDGSTWKIRFEKLTPPCEDKTK